MPNKRKRYRENKKKAKREEWLNNKIEERLSRKNEYGMQDLTPFEAINQIIEKDNRRGKNHEQ